MAFECNFYFLPFIIMALGPIISTHISFHGIYSDNLAGNLPYLLFLIVLYADKCHR